MTAPMTPERLAELMVWHKDCGCGCDELVAEVGRLRAANSDLEQYVRTYCPTPFEKAEVDRLRAENDRLREAPSCQRCGSYSHTSCPVAPWETQ